MLYIARESYHGLSGRGESVELKQTTTKKTKQTNNMKEHVIYKKCIYRCIAVRHARGSQAYDR